MARLLIVEDSESLSQSLKEYVGADGHEIHLAHDLKSAREKIALKPDLVILDWMLPDGQGVDFLRALREKANAVPVIFLTARIDLVDKVLGLELGANDYITKPFEPRELLARIRVQLRAAADGAGATGGATGARERGRAEAELVTVGPLTIDSVRHKVSFRGEVVELVKKEFELLLLLAESPEKVFSREEILNKVWGYDVFPTTRTVDTHIMLLRQKTHESLIETVRAVGYRLKAL